MDCDQNKWEDNRSDRIDVLEWIEREAAGHLGGGVPQPIGDPSMTDFMDNNGEQKNGDHEERVKKNARHRIS